MRSSGWKQVRLGEIILHKKGFAFKSKDLVRKGYPVVKVSNFTQDSVNINGCFYIDHDVSLEYKDVQLKHNDIVIATVGSWPNNPNSIVGKVVKIPENVDGALLNQNAVILRTKSDFESQMFIYYRLKNYDFSEHLISSARGSANQASISLEDIFRFNFLLPSLQIQEHIATILSTLDEKIELNSQINRTLETIAQAIYKEWFINFNFPNEEGKPYRDSNGEMQNSEFGLIPKGWRVGKLGEHINFIKGRKPKETSKKYIDGFLPQILIVTLDTGNYIFASPENMIVCDENNLIMVMDGASSGRVEFGIKGIVGSTLAIVKKIDFDFQYFLYQFLKSKELDIKANTTGSSIPHADKHKIINYSFIIPDISILQEYEKMVTNMYHLLQKNKIESQLLTKIRDNLLPKLMSGEIEV